MEKSGNPPNIAVGRIVMNTIRKQQGEKGISLPALKKVLRDTKKLDVGQHDAEIKLSLKNGIDRGLLAREDGNYKIREAKGRRSRSRSKGRKSRKRSKSKGRKRSGRKRSGSRRKRSRRRAKAAAPEE